MTVSAYSTTPGSNISINGISIAEGMPRANVNDAIRNIMADIATWTATYPAVSYPISIANGGSGQTTAAAAFNALAASGGTIGGPVTIGGSLTRTSAGNYAYWGSTGATGGQMFLQAIGGADPTVNPYDVVFEY